MSDVPPEVAAWHEEHPQIDLPVNIAEWFAEHPSPEPSSGGEPLVVAEDPGPSEQAPTASDGPDPRSMPGHDMSLAGLVRPPGEARGPVPPDLSSQNIIDLCAGLNASYTERIDQFVREWYGARIS